MSIEVKQKIKEVADDFAMPAKKLIEIVGKFYEKPKSSSQNLTEDQLNVIFDYITQQNQIDSIEQVFAAAAQKKEAPLPRPLSRQSPPHRADRAGREPAAVRRAVRASRARSRTASARRSRRGGQNQPRPAADCCPACRQAAAARAQARAPRHRHQRRHGQCRPL